jgi:hypothetical protein
MGYHTGIQIECPHIIRVSPVSLTTEDEELGVDHCYGHAVTNDGPGAIDHDAGPHLRYWRTGNSN